MRHHAEQGRERRRHVHRRRSRRTEIVHGALEHRHAERRRSVRQGRERLDRPLRRGVDHRGRASKCVEFRGVADRAGTFPQEPAACEWCDFTGVCGPRPLLERHRAIKTRDQCVAIEPALAHAAQRIVGGDYSAADGEAVINGKGIWITPTSGTHAYRIAYRTERGDGGGLPYRP